MGDFGLYAALSGTDNWAQKRQDKMSNLMMLERMEQRSEKQVAAQMQAEAGIQEMLDKMSTFDVLPEDQKAIEQKEQQARLSIIKGITKFNGDLKKYMSSGGVTDLGEYQRSILTSSEMKNAVSNKAQYAQYIDAKQKDMFVGRAEIDVPVFNSQGRPKMKNGEIVRERKNLTMEEQMALRKRGLLDRIQVGMIEKKARINPDYFKRNFKDAKKPWSADNIVTEQNVRNTLKSQGFSDEQANQLANEYGQGLTPETALKWKAMNQYELEKMKSEIAYRKAKAAGGKGSGKTQITNTLNTQYTRLKKNAGKMLPTIGKNADPTAQGASIRIPPKEQKFFKSYFEDVVPTAFDAHYANASEEEKNEGVGKYDLSNATVNLLEKVAKENPNTGQVESFIKAKVFYEDDFAPDDIMDYTYNVNNWKEKTRRIEIKDNDKDLGYRVEEKDGYEGIVFIPVEKEVYDKGFTTELAKFRNLGTNIQNYEAGNTFQGDVMNYQNNFKSMVDDLVFNQGYSVEEAERVVNYQMSTYGN